MAFRTLYKMWKRLFPSFIVPLAGTFQVSCKKKPITLSPQEAVF